MHAWRELAAKASEFEHNLTITQQTFAGTS